MLELFETTLQEVLAGVGSDPRADRLSEALEESLRYAVGTGGKRIRPLICLAAGGSDALYPAVAIELLHNYTLVHDDLPAMDNDTLRRGQPTVWTKFGEANAILAGDALQALAFRTAARAPRNVEKIIAILGDMAYGVVCGQVADIAQGSGHSCPRLSEAQKESIRFIYHHKTSDLFIAAAVMGGLARGASDAELAALHDFALNLGLAFQYEDDLLDGDYQLSREETERLASSTTAAAIQALTQVTFGKEELKSIAQKLLGRKV